MAAATEERRRQTACEPLQQRVGARVIAACSEVDVVRAEKIGERLRRKGWDNANPPERLVGVPCERDFECLRVEVAVDPSEEVTARTWVTGPARSDDPQALVPFAMGGRMEDRPIDGVAHDDGVAQLDTELTMLREAELRLQDRHVRELVDRSDAAIGAVVEP